MALITFINTFFLSLFSLLSTVGGLFLFVLMVIAGWTERERRPRAARSLFIGGWVFTIIWFWVQTGMQFFSKS